MGYFVVEIVADGVTEQQILCVLHICSNNHNTYYGCFL